MKLKYIREWSDGSIKYENISHWIEIQCFSNGINVAQNSILTSSFKPNLDVNGQSNIDTIINGRISLNEYVSVMLDIQRERPVFLMLTLPELIDIQAISIWHGWWFENNSYFNSLEVSTDMKHWKTIYDYKVDGLYNETQDGKTWYLD